MVNKQRGWKVPNPVKSLMARYRSACSSLPYNSCESPSVKEKLFLNDPAVLAVVKTEQILNFVFVIRVYTKWAGPWVMPDLPILCLLYHWYFLKVYYYYYHYPENEWYQDQYVTVLNQTGKKQGEQWLKTYMRLSAMCVYVCSSVRLSVCLCMSSVVIMCVCVWEIKQVCVL